MNRVTRQSVHAVAAPPARCPRRGRGFAGQPLGRAVDAEQLGVLAGQAHHVVAAAEA